MYLQSHQEFNEALLSPMFQISLLSDDVIIDVNVNCILHIMHLIINIYRKQFSVIFSVAQNKIVFNYNSIIINSLKLFFDDPVDKLEEDARFVLEGIPDFDLGIKFYSS